MKHLNLPLFPRRLAASVLLLAGSALPLLAADVPTAFGKITVKLSLDPGGNTLANDVFTPSEGVLSPVAASFGFFQNTYPISARSPVSGNTYPDACPSGQPLLYPFSGQNTPLFAHSSDIMQDSDINNPTRWRTAVFSVTPFTGDPRSTRVQFRIG